MRTNWNPGISFIDNLSAGVMVSSLALLSLRFFIFHKHSMF